MLDYLTNYFSDGGIYGTSPGLSTDKLTPEELALRYPSLAMGSSPIAAESFSNRKMTDFQSPAIMGQSAYDMGADGAGNGLQFNSRPSEGLYTPPANIRALSVQQLAQGMSNLPGLLGSNEPTGKKANNLDALMMAGAAMMNRQQQPAQDNAPPLNTTGWASSYEKRPFTEPGPFEKASPYTNPQLHKSRKLREAMVERERYERGLLG